jgi:gluconolactonase
MQFKLIASGYGLIEAPRVDDRDRLYFSDVPNGGVRRLSPDGSVEIVIPKRRGVGGMMFNRAGGLVLTGRNLIVWDEKTGQSRVIFGEWDGKPLMGLNDLTTDDSGAVYVGTLNSDPFSDAKRIPGSLFRIEPPNRVTKLWDGIELTNGMGLSPNRKLLYHSDSPTSAVWVYDVLSDGSVRDRRVFAKMPAGMPDGLAVDAEGGVWVAVVRVGEVVHIGPDAVVRERIKLPSTMVTSLTFGGADMMDLYIVTADNTADPDLKGSIFKARSEIPGLRVPKANF